MTHPFHLAVVKELQQRRAGRGELFQDPACGGTQHLPLFVGHTKERETHMCDVDMLIVSEGLVKIIVEIEESGFIPTKICGKFMQSAFATNFIQDSRPEHVFPYSNRVLFIQVLDGSKCLKPGTSKNLQARLIEEKIRDMLPIKGSTITAYHLVFVGGVNNPDGLESVGASMSDALT
ncbi:MAG: hypothetical protein WC832_05900 [Anaerolineales bacterium]